MVGVGISFWRRVFGTSLTPAISAALSVIYTITLPVPEIGVAEAEGVAVAVVVVADGEGLTSTTEFLPLVKKYTPTITSRMITIAAIILPIIV